MLFIITNSDGDTTICATTEAAFLAEVNAGDYGTPPQFMTSLDETDPNYWPEGTVLVLRGDLIVPAAVMRVSEWGLPK